MGDIKPGTAGIISGAVGAGLNIFDTLFNANQTEIANRHSEKFQWDMYDRQRTDAIADRDFQNSYNSPAAQMARLKAGGLNPNLVYGNGATQQPSAAPRAASGGSFTAKPATSDSSGAAGAVSKGLEMMYTLANTQANTNNLQANHNVIVEEAALKQAQTRLANQEAGLTAEKENTERYTQSRTDAERRLKEFELRQGTKLADIQVTKANLENEKLKADTKFTLDQNERAEALKATSIAEAAARILNLRYQNAKSDAERQHIQQSIKVLQADEQTKSLDNLLKQEGIQPHDNLFMRVLGNVMNRISPSTLQPYPNR